MTTRTLPVTDNAPLEKLLEALQRFLSEIPSTEEVASQSPDERAREVARNAAIKAAIVSGGLALPPGPFGYVTIISDLVGIWKIQAQMVADIAGAFGKTAPGFVRKPEDSYLWLRSYQPMARAGKSIFIYRLP